MLDLWETTFCVKVCIAITCWTVHKLSIKLYNTAWHNFLTFVVWITYMSKLVYITCIWETNLFKFDSPGELFLFCFEYQTYFPRTPWVARILTSCLFIYFFYHESNPETDPCGHSAGLCKLTPAKYIGGVSVLPKRYFSSRVFQGLKRQSFVTQSGLRRTYIFSGLHSIHCNFNFATWQILKS